MQPHKATYRFCNLVYTYQYMLYYRWKWQYVTNCWRSKVSQSLSTIQILHFLVTPHWPQVWMRVCVCISALLRASPPLDTKLVSQPSDKAVEDGWMDLYFINSIFKQYSSTVKCLFFSIFYYFYFLLSMYPITFYNCVHCILILQFYVFSLEYFSLVSCCTMGPRGLEFYLCCMSCMHSIVTNKDDLTWHDLDGWIDGWGPLKIVFKWF